MNTRQIHYCDKCGYASENRFQIEHHESIPDPPALPVKVGDQIWVESWISDEMQKRGETESPVLRTITAIQIASTPFGVEHQWQIVLDRPVIIENDDGFHHESYTISRVSFLFSKEKIEMDNYRIDALPSLFLRKQMSIDFYRDFSG